MTVFDELSPLELLLLTDDVPEMLEVVADAVVPLLVVVRRLDVARDMVVDVVGFEELADVEVVTLPVELVVAMVD